MKKIEFLKSGMKYIVIVVTLILCSKSLIAQKQLKKECFEVELNSENVFTKIEILPSFIGGSNTFKCFLNSVGGVSFLADELLVNDSSYFDTARVRFVISKYGVMSNLSVSKCLSESFKKEVYRVIKATACSWTPGNFSGRNVNGWVQMDLYFHLKRNQNSSVQYTFSFNLSDYKTND